MPGSVFCRAEAEINAEVEGSCFEETPLLVLDAEGSEEKSPTDSDTIGSRAHSSSDSSCPSSLDFKLESASLERQECRSGRRADWRERSSAGAPRKTSGSRASMRVNRGTESFRRHTINSKKFNNKSEIQCPHFNSNLVKGQHPSSERLAKRQHIFQPRFGLHQSETEPEQKLPPATSPR